MSLAAFTYSYESEIVNPNHKSTNRSPRWTLRVAACKCRICNGAHVFLECSVKNGEKETAPQKISLSLSLSSHVTCRLTELQSEVKIIYGPHVPHLGTIHIWLLQLFLFLDIPCHFHPINLSVSGLACGLPTLDHGHPTCKHQPLQFRQLRRQRAVECSTNAASRQGLPPSLLPSFK